MPHNIFELKAGPTRRKQIFEKHNVLINILARTRLREAKARKIPPPLLSSDVFYTISCNFKYLS